MSSSSRFGAIIFAAVLMCGLVVSSHASLCQDILVENIKVAPDQASAICASCSSLLSLNQCVACYRESKNLLQALRCPSSGRASNARVLPVIINSAIGAKALPKTGFSYNGGVGR